jgi:hypothetical protein
MIGTVPIKLTRLRKAIRNNQVSFPSQIPLFVRNGPGSVQRYSVQLYFLRGWNCGKIARRYGYSRFYIWQIVNEWKRHAVSLGYVQAIPPAGALLDLKNALQRTLDHAARPAQWKVQLYTDASSLISRQVAGPELTRPVEGRMRKAAAIRPPVVPSAQAPVPGKGGL